MTAKTVPPTVIASSLYFIPTAATYRTALNPSAFFAPFPATRNKITRRAAPKESKNKNVRLRLPLFAIPYAKHVNAPGKTSKIATPYRRIKRSLSRTFALLTFNQLRLFSLVRYATISFPYHLPLKKYKQSSMTLLNTPMSTNE